MEIPDLRRLIEIIVDEVAAATGPPPARTAP